MCRVVDMYCASLLSSVQGEETRRHNDTAPNAVGQICQYDIFGSVLNK